MTADEPFVHLWRLALDDLRDDLDLAAADDRAIFRGRVEHAFRRCTLDGICRVARGRYRTRNEAVRAVAESFITDTTEGEGR